MTAFIFNEQGKYISKVVDVQSILRGDNTMFNYHTLMTQEGEDIATIPVSNMVILIQEDKEEQFLNDLNIKE